MRSLSPGQEPGTETFTRFSDPQGGSILVFCWEGVGRPPDRGPMVAAETWTVEVGGTPATASRTSQFFGEPREVLAAWLRPGPGRSLLVYSPTLDREAFDRALSGATLAP